MAMENCIASSSSVHTPAPHASPASGIEAPPPVTASRSATTVSDMRMTHASGTQRSVTRESAAPLARSRSSGFPLMPFGGSGYASGGGSSGAASAAAASGSGAAGAATSGSGSAAPASAGGGAPNAVAGRTSRKDSP